MPVEQSKVDIPKTSKESPLSAGIPADPASPILSPVSHNAVGHDEGTTAKGPDHTPSPNPSPTAIRAPPSVPISTVSPSQSLTAPAISMVPTPSTTPTPSSTSTSSSVSKRPNPLFHPVFKKKRSDTEESEARQSVTCPPLGIARGSNHLFGKKRARDEDGVDAAPQAKKGMLEQKGEPEDTGRVDEW